MDRDMDFSRDQARHSLEQRLRRFSRARRHLHNAALGYRLGGLVATVMAAVMILASGWIRSVWFNALVSLAVPGALLFGLTMLARRHVRFKSALDEAFRFEALAGDLNSRLISALDFLGYERLSLLHRGVIHKALEDAQRVPERRFDRTARNLWRRRFAGLLVVLVLVGVNPWFGITAAVSSVRAAWSGVFDILYPVRYAWTPDEAVTVVEIGATVPIRLHFERRAFREAVFMAQRGEQVARTPLTPDATGAFQTTLTSPVEADYEVAFAFGNRVLPARRIVFTTLPRMENMQAELIFPAYTRLMPRTLEGIQTRLAALPGTRMAIGFTFSKPIESVVIEWDDGDTLPLEVVGRFAGVNLIHSRERRATLRVTDLHGLQPEFPPRLEFALQRDEPPRLFVPGHLTENMPMREGDVPGFGFGIRAEDDFGVTRCVLTWRQSTVDNPQQIMREGEIERLISPSQRRVVAAFEQIFETLALKSGDHVSIEVAVFDNRTPDAQVTRSRPISFFVHQDELGGLSLAELGFGGGASAARGRIPRARRTTTVAEPDATRTVEQFRVDFDAPIETSVVAPRIRGDHGQAAQDYFRLLTDVVFDPEGRRREGE